MQPTITDDNVISTIQTFGNCIVSSKNILKSYLIYDQYLKPLLEIKLPECYISRKYASLRLIIV